MYQLTEKVHSLWPAEQHDNEHSPTFAIMFIWFRNRGEIFSCWKTSFWTFGQILFRCIIPRPVSITNPTNACPQSHQPSVTMRNQFSPNATLLARPTLPDHKHAPSTNKYMKTLLTGTGLYEETTSLWALKRISPHKKSAKEPHLYTLKSTLIFTRGIYKFAKPLKNKSSASFITPFINKSVVLDGVSFKPNGW